MTWYAVMADLLVVLHAAYALCIASGLVLVPLGGAFGWSWVRNFWVRAIHLAMIAVVVVLAWTGTACPLTVLEKQLRLQSGETVYPGSFIGHWVHNLLFFDAPDWVFVAVYTAVGTSIAVCFLCIPPRRPSLPGRRQPLH